MLDMDQLNIPKYLALRPKWKGLPIPYTTMIKPDGDPDFRVTDQQRWVNCVTQGLCGLCGSKLMYWQAFIGGEKCKETHLFFDPAMHVECAEFAAKACPFIVGCKGYSITTTQDGRRIDSFLLNGLSICTYSKLEGTTW